MRSWCRLYTGTRNHRKIRVLRERCPDTWTFWYVLIELAGECDDAGWIYLAPDHPFTDKQLAKELGIRREDTWKKLRSCLEELQLITISDKGILLNSFAERNYESDLSTPRVRKYRERQKEKQRSETFPGNVTETPQNRTEQNGAEQSRNAADSPKANRRDLAREFDELFWPAYPNRKGRGHARKCYLTQGKKGVLPPVEDLLAALEAQKRWTEWREAGGKFIPHPATWLNGERWTDQCPEKGGALSRGKYAQKVDHIVVENTSSD